MALSETSIANMALAKIGAKRINNIETDSSLEAIQCRTHFEQTRDALLRSFEWPFATARVELSEDATAPDFEWSHQYILPDDFLRLVSDYEDDATDLADERHTIEGERLLSNSSASKIRYIRRITDVTKFDALFVEALVLQLALKLLHPLAGTSNTTLNLKQGLMQELGIALSKARTVSRQENNTSGRSDWNLARLGRTG